jgi:hypothetical protein
MLSIQLFRVIVDERERAIEDHLRARRLLRRAEPDREVAQEAAAAQPAPWRASRPRARATTR